MTTEELQELAMNAVAALNTLKYQLEGLEGEEWGERLDHIEEALDLIEPLQDVEVTK